MSGFSTRQASQADMMADMMAAMLAGSPYAFLLFDHRFQLLHCNEKAMKFMGTDSLDALRGNFFKRIEGLLADAQGNTVTAPTVKTWLLHAAQTGALDLEARWSGNGESKEVKLTLLKVPFGRAYAISCSVADVTTTRRAHNILLRQDNLLQSINRVGVLLMEASTENFDRAIWQSLEIIGRTMHVDRTYIWQNFDVDGVPHCGQIYEWSEDAEPQQGNSLVSMLPYSEVPVWHDHVTRGQPLNYMVRELPAGERGVLQAQSILSILVIPIMVNGIPWGFIGFDDCTDERHFSPVEEQVLLSAGTLLVSAIVRNKTTLNLQEQIVATQRASRASEYKSNFLARASHEIRTPMNAIIGMSELALREHLSPDVRGYVSDIHNAGTSLLAIINDILDLSKIESGKMEIMPVSYPLSALLKDVISIIRIRAAQKNLLFTVHIACSLPEDMYGDSLRIRQVLVNVLDNAIKYTETGCISLRVTSEILDEAREQLVLLIEDSGIGIRKEDFERLFEGFVQLDARQHADATGTGLGLAISRSFLRAMGGDITVESEYGKGSVFRIVCPQTVQSGKRIIDLDEFAGQSILLYCECEKTTNSILETLRSMNVSHDVAQSRQEFEALLQNNTYAHIIVSPSLYAAIVPLCEAAGCRGAIALLQEIDSRPPAADVTPLPMPVHALELAQLLGKEKKDAPGTLPLEFFTAPEARILIVDDNPTNLRVAMGLMKPYKMRLEFCTSGAQALDRVAQRRYDIIFMDHMMPEMDGVETARSIRNKADAAPHFAEVPIIALTANAIVGTREMFLENGMNDFLSKPINTVKLHGILQRWLPPEKMRPACA